VCTDPAPESGTRIRPQIVLTARCSFQAHATDLLSSLNGTAFTRIIKKGERTAPAERMIADHGLSHPNLFTPLSAG
jgi:hypothetical protein